MRFVITNLAPQGSVVDCVAVPVGHGAQEDIEEQCQPPMILLLVCRVHTPKDTLTQRNVLIILLLGS